MIAVLACASAGEWVPLFRQTMPMVKPVSDWHNVNSDDSSNPNYSILDALQLNGEDFKIDGKFHFKMVWPGASGANTNEWSQTSNPMTVVANSGGIQGYEAIEVNHDDNRWGGLEYNGEICLMDGSASHGNWFYAVGTNDKWQNAIPGWSNPEDVTELWVYTDYTVTEHWELVFRQTMPMTKPASDWYNVNSDDSSNPNYSILDQLDDFKYGNKFTFRMAWPGASGAGTQEWSQTSNPTTVVAASGGVQGYQAIEVSHTDREWGGLEYNGGSCLMDGSASHGWWFYAVGTNNKWRNAIPGWSNPEDVTELWVLRREVKLIAGKWVPLFRQTMPMIKEPSDWYNVNSDDSSNPNYSILDQLRDSEDDFKQNGRFTFKMAWPGASGEGTQEWSQTSNPTTVVAASGGVQGYQTIEVSHTSRNWGGLEYNGGICLMDGSVDHGNWFYAVGTRSKWGNAIPGWNNPEDVTELYVYRTEFFASDSPTSEFTLALNGVTVAEVEANLGTYRQGIATALGVSAGQVTITVETSSRRRLTGGVILTATVTSLTAADDSNIQDAVQASSFVAAVATQLTVPASALAVVLVVPCTVTCELSSANLVQVLHNTASQHTHHRCYMQDSQDCICSCCNTATADCNVESNYHL